MCCDELRSALDDKDSGFSVVSKNGELRVRMNLGTGSYIDSQRCVFCENEISVSALETRVKQDVANGA
jgi:hypothetical protein